MCFPTWETHIPSDMYSGTEGKHIWRHSDMCSTEHLSLVIGVSAWYVFPWTHIPGDMCFSTRETHIPSDMCSRVGEVQFGGTHITVTSHWYVFPRDKRGSLARDMCFPEHISLVICVPGKGKHISLGRNTYHCDVTVAVAPDLVLTHEKTTPCTHSNKTLSVIKTSEHYSETTSISDARKCCLK